MVLMSDLNFPSKPPVVAIARRDAFLFSEKLQTGPCAVSGSKEKWRRIFHANLYCTECLQLRACSINVFHCNQVEDSGHKLSAG